MPRYVNLKNTVVLFFILCYISAVLGLHFYYEFGLNKNSGEVARSFFNSVRYPLEIFHLYNGWAYFSAPPKEEYHFLIRGHEAGFSVYYTPGFQSTGFKIRTEKSRKFHSKISTHYSDIRNAYLKSFCKKFEKEYGRTFNDVTFHVYKKPIPELTSSDPTEMQEIRKWTVKC